MKPLLIFLLLFSSSVFGQNQNIPTKHFLLTKAGIALDGFDPTSYFAGKKPLKGKPEFALKHEGVIYHFASESNKQTFSKNANKYIPAYGGWCAYAIGKTGAKVEPDFENFKIVDGRVNLFYKNFFTNTLDDWNKDEANLNSKAIKNWESIIKK
jgi:YHS domain-containing protein